jgi:hypothetical protein
LHFLQFIHVTGPPLRIPSLGGAPPILRLSSFSVLRS